MSHPPAPPPGGPSNWQGQQPNWQGPPVWQGQPEPNNHLAMAIIVTLLCCWPLGIPAIVNATKVSRLWSQGRYDEAQQSANRARTWSIVALCGAAVWVIGILIYIAIFGLAVFEGIQDTVPSTTYTPAY
jgi:hypothetical protein